MVDSALATAKELQGALKERELGRPLEDLPRRGSLRIHVTDLPSRFREQAARFLGRSVEEVPVELVDL